MLEMRKAGKLRLGVDNQIALKIAQSGLIPKNSSVSAALHMWSFVAIAVSGYFSFTASWWWFIPGFIGMMVIHGANKSGNSENVLDTAERDPFLYEKLRAHGI